MVKIILTHLCGEWYAYKIYLVVIFQLVQLVLILQLAPFSNIGSYSEGSL